MNFSIEPIKAEHIPGFCQALDNVARERMFLDFLEGPELKTVRAFVLENIRVGNPSFVALVEGQVVGWCHTVVFKTEIFCHSGELGMGVLCSYRGQGIGHALILSTIRRAKEIGLKRIELRVRQGNKAAMALYQKVGFEVEGVKKRGARLSGVYEDIYCMGLLLE